MMFNETLTEPRSYADFIEKLRRRVVHDNCTSAGGVPMLPPKEGREKNNYFHIILIYKDKDKINEDIEITLQIKQVNLYLVAFKGTNGQWYAFGDDKSIAPPNSKWLTFTGMYPSDDSNVRTKVGRQSLKDAISGLAKYHETEKETQKIHSFLFTLIVMFPEAIRFKRVAEFVNPYMLKGEPEKEIGIAINDLIHKWDAISEEMRRHDQFGGNFNFSGFPKANITTVEQAVSTVGILLYQKVPPIPKHTKGPDKKK